MTEPTTCGTTHDDYPDTTCTQPPRHHGPHAGPLVIEGDDCGAIAWGPDDWHPDNQEQQ